MDVISCILNDPDIIDDCSQSYAVVTCPGKASISLHACKFGLLFHLTVIPKFINH